VVQATRVSSADPIEAALRWQAQGAQWIHLVDLDAAYGRGRNRELLARIVGVLDIDVELSGGIDDDESLRAALATGCRRANLATSALADAQWCAGAIGEHGDRVAVGLDLRGGMLAPRGGASPGASIDAGLGETIAHLDEHGCARYVITDVDADGALAGPNLDLLRAVCALTDRPVVASGGVATLADLTALIELAPLGVEGAIVGTALYDGRFTLPEALRLIRSA
jgi:1-(5-phosphoribosyl)-5-[(5-phosphoribosylamino)methylideneamino] imidazole-4-carboxamide isomerase/N-(5'phosphoribosyl)anthranilate isomerase